MSEKIVIFDTTLRDGEQSAGVSFSADDKLELALLLAAMGVDVIEAGFPMASVSEQRAVSRVAREVRGASICALARAVEPDVDAAIEALRGAEHGRIHVFINSSDVQLAHQLYRNREQVIESAVAAVRHARRGAAEVEFSPMDATRADVDFLEALIRAVLAAGASTINIPDTVGYSLPQQTGALIRELRRRVPELQEAVISFHGQDDLGMATANAIAAVTAGARQVELCVNGIGERAGNTSFEEVVMALQVHGEHLGVHTDIRTQGIHGVSRAVEAKSGLCVPHNKAVVGKNAFRHASGIHQDGVLKHRSNYEVLDPADVGHPHGSQIVLGKLSGRAGFADKARSLGFTLAPAALAQGFERFQQLADTRREVADAEVIGICRELTQR